MKLVSILSRESSAETITVCSQHMNGTELTCNKSIQLHDALIGHALRRHDLIIMIG